MDIKNVKSRNLDVKQKLNVKKLKIIKYKWINKRKCAKKKNYICKQSGIKSQRKRCCTWKVRSHKGMVDSKKYGRKCKWVGMFTTHKRKLSCKWMKKSKNSKQKRCCTYTKSCKRTCAKVGSCKNHGKKCKWEGFIIKVTKNSKCYWKAYSVKGGRKGRKRYCCHMTNRCEGETCKVVRKQCKLVKTIYVKSHSKCSTKKFVTKKNHHGKMKVCCTWMERCSKSIKKGKSCKKLNKKCKKSERITWWNGKNCKWVKVKNGRHKRCCSYKNYCVGKKCSKKK